MTKVIIERNSLTEYRSASGVAVAYAIRADRHTWELVDANNGLVEPFASFFSTKKEIEHSIMFELIKELAELA